MLAVAVQGFDQEGVALIVFWWAYTIQITQGMRLSVGKQVIVSLEFHAKEDSSIAPWVYHSWKGLSQKPGGSNGRFFVRLCAYGPQRDHYQSFFP